MGIPELWTLIGEGEVTSIAHLAADHFQRTGRPLRIAVDEAGWRFNNLTEQQVYAIRQKSNEPAYNGIEKNFFFRLCRILKLNVQLLFVFDGKHRPWKRGKSAGRIDWDKIKLVKQLLAVLKIPYHEAPAEAEAECARLQTLGIVDAVWSEDSDALMFGCSFLIRDHRVAKKNGGSTDRSKENTQKSAITVLVHHAEKIQQKHQLDREGLVLFAVLVGGDYDTTGLRGCGPSSAMKAVKNGLGRSLCRCKTDFDLGQWRNELHDFFKGKYPIPQDFPRLRNVKNYNSPMVSTDEQIHNLRGLRNGWDVPFDEAKLLDFTGARFNIWGKGYMSWIGPILLARSFAKCTIGTSNPHKVQLTRRRNKPEVENTPPLETKITFSPFGVTSLNEQNLSNGYWGGAKDIPFDPDHRVECEILDCLLRKALPAEVFDTSTVQPKRSGQKRKREANHEFVDTEQQESLPSKRGPISQRSQNHTTTYASSSTYEVPQFHEGETNSMATSSSISPLVNSTPFMLPTAASECRAPSALKLCQTNIIDIFSESENESDDDLKRAIELSLQEDTQPRPSHPPVASARLQPASIPPTPRRIKEPVPAAREKILALNAPSVQPEPEDPNYIRAARLLRFAGNSTRIETKPITATKTIVSSQTIAVPAPSKLNVEYIDLT